MTNPTTPDVVIGEMRPWSDRDEGSFLAGGPVLAELLDGVHDAGRVLVLGPTQDEIIGALAEQAASVNVLVRSTTDAEIVRHALGASADVVVGGLEAFTPEACGRYDTIIAVDGLDRVLSFETAPLVWSDVLAQVASLLAPGGTAFLTHPLALSARAQLDARPVDERFGDDDFHPFEVDERRPLDGSSLLKALAEADLPLVNAAMLFGNPRAPRVAWNLAAALPSASHAVPLRAALEALTSCRTPMLASGEELTTTYFRAGRPLDAADALFVVVGSGSGFSGERSHDIVIARDGLLVSADHDADEREWDLHAASVPTIAWPDAEHVAFTTRDTAQPSETLRYVAEAAPISAPVVTRADLVPGRVADGPSVGTQLRRLAALGDVPAFRELAARVGDFVVAQPASQHRVFDFDDMFLTPTGVSLGFSALSWTQPASSEESLAAAWFAFEDDLRDNHRRHPWPSWVMGEPNVASWLEAAGASSEQPVLKRGRELADALAAHRRATTAIVPPLRTALADAEAAQREALELRGHVAGLERTIGFRDKQLKTRGEVIRKLRDAPGTTTPAGGAASLTRLAKRTAQVRSVDELTAGLNRVVRRAKRKIGQ